MRGEQRRWQAGGADEGGSPPRARGAGGFGDEQRDGAGITPACAGSRTWHDVSVAASPDHPRVRGEQAPPGYVESTKPGSPPRARGAGTARGRRWPRPRITPACAGSSCPSASSATYARDHPRVRGEQALLRVGRVSWSGSPPRARGAAGAPASPGDWRPGGITPACAGSRAAPASAPRWGRDHPPRARGAGSSPTSRSGVVGITPACAGSRRRRSYRLAQSRDHPRVRGEQSQAAEALNVSAGSPPRARGAEPDPPVERDEAGITPACAGSRLLDLRRYRSTTPISFTLVRKIGPFDTGVARAARAC